MATQEIEQHSWSAFLDDFSKQNEGATGVIETFGPDVGDRRTARMPFQGISYEQKGSAAGAVIIMLGTDADNHVERIIESVASLRLKPAGEAGPTVLEIQAESAPTVLLHLEPMTALPPP